jgi:hypothetical protein
MSFVSYQSRRGIIKNDRRLALSLLMSLSCSVILLPFLDLIQRNKHFLGCTLSIPHVTSSTPNLRLNYPMLFDPAVGDDRLYRVREAVILFSAMSIDPSRAFAIR